MKKLIKKILKEEVVDITDIQDELLMMPLDELVQRVLHILDLEWVLNHILFPCLYLGNKIFQVLIL